MPGPRSYLVTGKEYVLLELVCLHQMIFIIDSLLEECCVASSSSNLRVQDRALLLLVVNPHPCGSNVPVVTPP